jgi:hypothetical protein
MCGGGSKGQSQSTTTQTPNALPEYGYLLGRANQVGSQPYVPYGGQLVADLTPMQQQGMQQLGQVFGSGQPFINQAQQYQQNAANPITSAQIQNYADPYQQMVTDATMRQLENVQQANNAAQMGGTYNSGGLFNDRAGVMAGQQANQQAIANAQTLGQLNTANYAQALQAAQADRTAQQNAVYGMGALGSEQQQLLSQGAQATLMGGGLGQQQQQNILNSLYGQWQQQQAFPYQQLSWLAGLGTGIGSQMGGTSNTVQTPAQPNPFNMYGGLGLAGLGLYANMNQPPSAPTTGATAPVASGGRIKGFQAGGSPYGDEGDPMLSQSSVGGQGLNLPYGSGVPQLATGRPAGSPFAKASGYIPQAPQMPSQAWGIKVPGAGGAGQQQQGQKTMADWEKAFEGAGKGIEKMFGKGAGPKKAAGDETTTKPGDGSTTPPSDGAPTEDAGTPDPYAGTGPEGPYAGEDPGAGGYGADAIQTADADTGAGFDSSLGQTASLGTDAELGGDTTALAGGLGADTTAMAGDVLGSDVAAGAATDAAGMSMADLLPLLAFAKQGGGIKGFALGSGVSEDDQPGGNFDIPGNQPSIEVPNMGLRAGRPVDVAAADGAVPAPDATTPAPPVPPEEIPTPRPKPEAVPIVPGRPRTETPPFREPGRNAGPPLRPGAGTLGDPDLNIDTSYHAPQRSNALGNALLTAGASMMGSRSPWFGPAVGYALGAALPAYHGTQQEEKQEALSDQAHRENVKRLAQARDMTERKFMELQRQHRWQEQHPAGSFGYEQYTDPKTGRTMMRYVPGGPQDPAQREQLETAKANAKANGQLQAQAAQIASMGGPKAVDDLAEMYRVMGKGAFTNIGRGPAIDNLKQQAIARAYAMDDEAHITREERARLWQKYASEGVGLNAMQRNISTAEGKMGMAAFEAKGQIDLARGSIDRVTRTGIKPLNQIIMAANDAGLNPDEAELRARIQSVINTYSAVMSRGASVTTDSSRAHAEALLERASNPVVFNRVLDTMIQEIDMAQKAPDQMRRSVYDSWGFKEPDKAFSPGTSPGPNTGVGASPAPRTTTSTVTPVLTPPPVNALPPGTYKNDPRPGNEGIVWSSDNAHAWRKLPNNTYEQLK